MSKVYLITDADIEELINSLEIDPEKKSRWAKDEEGRRIFKEAHRFYNYIVRRWIDKIQG